MISSTQTKVCGIDNDASSFGSSRNCASDEPSQSTQLNGTKGNTESSGENSAKIRENLSKNETRDVVKLRVATLLVMSVVTVAVAVLVYFLTKNSEENQLESQYNGVASQIITSFDSVLDHAGAFVSVRNAATIFGMDQLKYTNVTWPFVTMSSFEQRAATARLVSGSLRLSMSPLISDYNRDQWEAFVTKEENKQWIADGIQYQKDIGIEVFETNPLPEDVVMITLKPIVYYESDGLDPIVDPGPGPYLPEWQSSPFLTKKDVNENHFKDLDIWNEVHTCLEQEVATLSRMEYAPMGSIDDTDKVTAYYATLQSMASKELSTYLGDPMLRMCIPIYDSFSTDKNARNEVGALISVIHWRTYFLNLMTKSNHGIIAVLDNKCDSPFSYRIDGPDAIPLGIGDYHDPTFNPFMRTTSIDHFDIIHDGTRDGTLVDNSTGCVYTLHIYPSQEFYDEYVTNTPALITFAVSICFVFIVFVFLFYDLMVERRQTKVLNRAVHTTQIVATLFPKQVRDRLLQEQEDSDQNKKGTKDFLRRSSRIQTFLTNGDEGLKGGNNLATIADLFPECTVSFADIAGFTAWSSTRGPEEVFVLLQTVYQGFDYIAKRRKVFKVETIGDCYLAVTGLPEPQPSHAMIMARFAWECKHKMNELMRELEVNLGPDCSDLKMRFGMHSGPVTAGVLRGDRARFQLFGDTVNTASRMESTGTKDKIQVSQSTADILMKAGKSHWVTPREDRVEARGKGIMNTFWLKLATAKSKSSRSSDAGSATDNTHTSNSSNDNNGAIDLVKHNRLVDWMVELLLDHVRKMVAKRKAIGIADVSNSKVSFFPPVGSTCLEEVKEVISMAKFDSKAAAEINGDDVVHISLDIAKDLREFVSIISSMYRSENPFHNFEHACHVTMSVNKLLRRIVEPELHPEDLASPDGEKYDHLAAKLHDYTYGITSDPLALFAIVFSALIHDVDHRGCSNAQLIKEEPHLGSRYKNQSVAEQNSLDLAWNLLMSDRFERLRVGIFQCQEELLRFRSFIVNSVLATDIFDKELNDLRKTRWTKAFSEKTEDDILHSNRKATIVIEHIIQASDVSHTMQHWHVYVKWNTQLFKEMYQAYQAGRMGVDPSTFWYQGEISFFDNYVIPLAKKLKDCCVFGVSSDEYLNYAVGNRSEWVEKGESVIEDIMNEMQNENLDDSRR